LELLKEMVPKVSRVGVLFNPTVQAHRLLVKEMEGAAHASGVELHLVEA